MKQVNTVIIPSLGLNLNGQKISEASAQHWLAKLRYELKEVKKGVYVDGHEHEDVVAYRKEYLEQFSANKRYKACYLNVSIFTDMSKGFVVPTGMRTLNQWNRLLGLERNYMYLLCTMSQFSVLTSFDNGYMLPRERCHFKRRAKGVRSMSPILLSSRQED